MVSILTWGVIIRGDSMSTTPLHSAQTSFAQSAGGRGTQRGSLTRHLLPRDPHPELLNPWDELESLGLGRSSSEAFEMSPGTVLARCSTNV